MIGDISNAGVSVTQQVKHTAGFTALNINFRVQHNIQRPQDMFQIIYEWTESACWKKHSVPLTLRKLQPAR